LTSHSRDKPLPQLYKFTDLVEGGSFNFLVQHGNNTILINGATYVGGEFYGVRADVAFIGIPWYGEDQRRQDDWYAQTVAEVQPQLVVPTHWDDFFTPLSNHLEIASATAGEGWDYVIKRLSADGRQFGIMQGYQSIMLFERK
jgi:hypothetical protein